MQVNRCIESIVRASGKTYADVSADCGKSSSWGRNVAKPTRSPALATVVEIARACGYRLDVVDVKTGEVLGAIEAPRSAKDAPKAIG